MVTANEIGWGTYRQYEGPFYLGKHSYVLPKEPTKEDMILAVITATEGGHYDAWNGYDVCGWTSGLIQWCEGRGQYSVSDMLGVVDEIDEDLIEDVDVLAVENKMVFRRNNKNRYRFHFLDSRGEVDSAEEQRQLFYLHGDGTKGAWTEEAKLYAKRWAAAISSVWEDPVAQRAQQLYTVKRLDGFMLPYAKSIFADAPDTSVARAAKAAYLSFAANNPTWANTSLQKAHTATPALPAWSIDWFVAILKELTFGPQVAIYPHRYDAIRPVLEKLYGLNLPDFSKELAFWKGQTGFTQAFTAAQLQKVLIALGFDLGPKKADGVVGKKTREALLTFEQLNGVPAQHQDGMPDVHTWPILERVLASRGIDLPGP